MGQLEIVTNEFVGPFGDIAQATVECPVGESPVAGNAFLDSAGLPTYLQTESRSTANGWEGAWRRVPGAPVDAGSHVSVTAICAPDEIAGCVERVSSITELTPQAKTAQVMCPVGSFAIGGGIRVVDDLPGIVIDSFGTTGMMAPVGIKAHAHRLGGLNPLPFSVEVEAWCAPIDVLATMKNGSMNKNGATTIVANPSGYAPWTSVSEDQYLLTDMSGNPATSFVGSITCGNPGMLGNGLSGGSYVMACAGYYTPGGMDNADQTTWRTLRTTDLVKTTNALGECSNDGFSEAVLKRFAIGATIIFGVAEGGGGLIWLPGKGPVPIDPTWMDAFDALPVAALPYADERQLYAQLETIETGLDEERTAWRETTNVEDALRDDGSVLIVTPGNDESAVRWLSANRDTLAKRSAPVIVMLDGAGDGFASLASW